MIRVKRNGHEAKQIKTSGIVKVVTTSETPKENKKKGRSKKNV